MNLETRAKELREWLLECPDSVEQIESRILSEFRAVEKEALRTLMIVMKERVARAIDRIHADII